MYQLYQVYSVRQIIMFIETSMLEENSPQSGP